MMGGKLNRSGVAAGLLALAVGGAGFAQVQQVDMGRSMDANMQVGSGGSNRPVRGYVPINQNDIISGNVAGLKYFHGTTTRSPYEFGGTLGSSNLSNFARQSAGGVGNNGLGQVYYLPSSTVSTLQGGLNAAPTGGGFDSALVPRSSVSPLASDGQVRGLGEGNFVRNGAFDRITGSAPLTPGGPGAALSSAPFALRVPEVKQGEAGSETGPGMLRGNPTANGERKPPKEEANGRPLPVGGDQGPNGKGAQLNLEEKPTEDKRISGLYRTLQEDLKKSEEKAAPKEGGGLGAKPEVKESAKGAGGLDYDPLTGLPRKITRKPGTGAGAAVDPLDPKRGGEEKVAMSARRLEDMSVGTLRAGGAMAPLKTLVQSKEAGATTVDVMLGRAEKSLKDGKYLEAAQAYQLALESEPGNALALVGRGNAELGAGMYQSAAYDLKFAFTRNPQMIGVRYDAETFFGSKRMDYLVKDLRTLAEGREMADTGSFLICYLHYQGGRMEELKAELGRWGGRKGHDSWQEVLNKAWNPDYAVNKPAATRPAP